MDDKSVEVIEPRAEMVGRTRISNTNVISAILFKCVQMVSDCANMENVIITEHQNVSLSR
jgi:hypothetical protein